jgi:hypothetical protein
LALFFTKNPQRGFFDIRRFAVQRDSAILFLGFLVFGVLSASVAKL